jgi:hypothetical protein
MSMIDSSTVLASGTDGYQIERSLRFNSADSAYLNRTPASAGSAQKFTLSAWVKIASPGNGSQQITLLGAGTGAQSNTANDNLQLRGNGTGLRINLLGQGGTGGSYAEFSAYHRDPSSWQHVVVAVDTTQATQANRCRAYFNGVEETAYVANGFSLNYNFGYLNTTAAHVIGRCNETGGPKHTDAYITETHFIDGQALTPSSFGETDTITGVWKPKRYTGTYGTNGFFLNFSDNSGTTSTTLGKDSSGNGNNWTPNNFSVTAGAGNDSLIDTPTPYADGGNGRGNYATLNPLSKIPSTGTASIADGNLSYVGDTTGSTTNGFNASIGISSGKFYWEVAVTNGLGAESRVGILGYTSGNMESNASAYYFYRNNTGGLIRKYDGTSFTDYASYYGSFTSGDIWMFAFDADSGKIWYGKNGSWFNNASGAKDPSTGTNADSTGIPSGTWYPSCAGFTTSASGIVNFGQRAFAYTPPSGFKALNTGNLPEPSIKKPGSYMDTTLYTGNGSARSITGLGFSPDFVWIKQRNGAGNHNLFDAVRGANKMLISNLTDSEYSRTQALTSFDSSGFSLGTSSDSDVNVNSNTYVAWCWDESATPGFDIVTYTGTGSNTTVAHSLGVAPAMVIVKARSLAGENWRVWQKDLTSGTHYLNLSATSAQASNSSFFTAAPTSTVINVGTDNSTNANGTTYVAYLWSEVAGFSKFGSYTGNGSADGPFVFCGFRPRWLMIKCTNTTGDWFVYDTARDTENVSYKWLKPNSSGTEPTGGGDLWDILSNGFKVRNNNANQNGSSNTYIFAAFAEAPFKYSLAR